MSFMSVLCQVLSWLSGCCSVLCLVSGLVSALSGSLQSRLEESTGLAPSLPLQRTGSLFKAEGRGESKRPLLLSLSMCVPSAPSLCHTPRFCFLSLSCIHHSSLSPVYCLSIHLFSFCLSSFVPIYIQ